MFSELRKNKIKFDYWINSFKIKNDDKRAVPILIKYIEQFDEEWWKMMYISALGVKGFNNATEYLILKYKEYLHPYASQE